MRGKYRRRSLARRIRAAADTSSIAALWQEAQQLRLSLPADVQKIVKKPTRTRTLK